MRTLALALLLLAATRTGPRATPRPADPCRSREALLCRISPFFCGGYPAGYAPCRGRR